MNVKTTEESHKGWRLKIYQDNGEVAMYFPNTNTFGCIVESRERAIAIIDHE